MYVLIWSVDKTSTPGRSRQCCELTNDQIHMRRTCSLAFSNMRTSEGIMLKLSERRLPIERNARFISNAEPYCSEYCDDELELEDNKTSVQMYSMRPILTISDCARRLRLHFCRIPRAFCRIKLSTDSVLSTENKSRTNRGCNERYSRPMM